jgi:hypothetical protein
VPTPNDRASKLNDVDALSSSDAWAVGARAIVYGLGTTSKTLIERWNGSTWSIVPSPNPSTGENRLDDVVALSPTDAWAVGTTTLHWTGSSWVTVANPCGPLSAITAVSARDLWAVGGATTCHYDGTAWRVVSGAQPGYGQSLTLTDVSAVGAGEVWAVGSVQSCDWEGNCPSAGFVERWNGTVWSTAPSPPGQGLSSVTTAGAGNAWVVGTPEQAVGPVIAHWDGQRWDQLPAPTRDGELFAVDALDAGHLWAVGRASTGGRLGTLVLDAPSATQGAVVGSTGITSTHVSWFGSSSGTVPGSAYQDSGIGGLVAGTYTLVASYPYCTPAMATVTVTAGVIKRQDLPVHC